ncbi:uncharacterized protein LOC126973166 [Leptidea sinapis]|uniref:uncharacterized protein LOC126973166 n=1 Tax=Leptidea sinapis TaxID=189913 RepID=UPI0021C2D0A8|nr:uncharacterized protein LOC126973166 [Leptidea sinapis]
MSIHVENNLKDSNCKDVFEQKAQYIPCKIEADGTANVSQYFEPYVNDNGNGELTATFRGHALDGVIVPLPEGYRGAMLTEAHRPLSEDSDRKFHVASLFKDIMYWNWDKKPSKNDNLVKALEWIDIADAVSNDNSSFY